MPGELHLDTNGKYGVKLRMSLFEMDATYRKSLSQRLSSYWKLLPRYSNDLKLVASSSTFHWSPNSMSLQATNNSERRKGRGSNNHSQGNGFLWKPWLPLFFLPVYKTRMAVLKVAAYTEAGLGNSRIYSLICTNPESARYAILIYQAELHTITHSSFSSL